MLYGSHSDQRFPACCAAPSRRILLGSQIPRRGSFRLSSAVYSRDILRFTGISVPGRLRSGRQACRISRSLHRSLPFSGAICICKIVTKRLQFKLSSRDKYRLGGQPRCVTLIAASSGRSSASSAASAADSYSGGSAFATPPLFLTPDHLPSLCRLRHE